MTVPVSIIIHTLNEETNLPHALDSVMGWADQVCVVDSESTDATQKIACMKGAEVYSRACNREGLVDQRNWALDTISFRNEWVFVLDADEIMEDALKVEVESLVLNDDGSRDGYLCRWKAYFMGKWIKRASMYPSWSLRLFLHKKVRYEKREVNSHPMVPPERSGYLKHHFLHIDHKGFANYLKRLDEFSSLEAKAQYKIIHNVQSTGIINGKLFGTQLEKRRYLKNFFIKLPFRPLVIFAYLYFVRMGFLDGKAGLDFCIWKAILEWSINIKVKELFENQP